MGAAAATLAWGAKWPGVYTGLDSTPRSAFLHPVETVLGFRVAHAFLGGKRHAPSFPLRALFIHGFLCIRAECPDSSSAGCKECTLLRRKPGQR